MIADCVFSGTPSVAIDHRSGKALVTNCTFTGTGGALFCLNSAETVMVACTIDGMSTGAYISEGSLSLVNCTIRDVDNAITIYDGDGPTRHLH